MPAAFDELVERARVDAPVAPLALLCQAGGERELREALRSLALANNVLPLDAEAVSVVNDAAGRLALELSADGRLGVRANGDGIDRIVALAFAAMLDGSWERLLKRLGIFLHDIMPIELTVKVGFGSRVISENQGVRRGTLRHSQRHILTNSTHVFSMGYG